MGKKSKTETMEERKKQKTTNKNKEKKRIEKIKIQSHTTSGEKRGFHDENLKGLRYISRS